jgi:hypothetical protein
MASLLDRYIPLPDVRERHEITIHAPPGLVLDVARDFDMQSIALVRAIIRLRAWVLRAPAAPARRPAGLVAETLAMGWGRLAEVPDRCFVAGAACRPWQANVVFTPIPSDRFATFSAPGRVKIAWTLEAEPLGLLRTRFASETRAVATDEVARAKFRRYWRTFRIGVVAIRWLILPALRREAERRWRQAERARAGLDEPATPMPTRGPALTLTAKASGGGDDGAFVGSGPRERGGG